jgi:hypothetical protein
VSFVLLAAAQKRTIAAAFASGSFQTPCARAPAWHYLTPQAQVKQVSGQNDDPLQQELLVVPLTHIVPSPQHGICPQAQVKRCSGQNVAAFLHAFKKLDAEYKCQDSQAQNLYGATYQQGKPFPLGIEAQCHMQ